VKLKGISIGSSYKAKDGKLEAISGYGMTFTQKLAKRKKDRKTQVRIAKAGGARAQKTKF
jgi:hypothetical protein